MIRFPYGIADFHSIRRQGLIYVDRTRYVRELEELGQTLVFLRPRRFGKSLWLQTLANYYDLRLADDFEQLFGDLAIGARPTPLRNRYFVLQWNFSNVDPQGGVEKISASLREHVSSRAAAFVSDYEAHLASSVTTDADPATVLDSLLAAVRKTPYRLYLLIDEYDNFINEVMVRVATYRALLDTDGPYKRLFKSVKNATEGQGLERIFVTGVSPVALNDLTSGFNNAKNVSLDPALGSLCGFRESEILELLEAVGRERDLSQEAVAAAAESMRTWYNGYLFSHGPPAGTRRARGSQPEPELVYNPTNSLYFLESFLRWGTPPEKLHDENLRTDRGKLAFLARSAVGSGVIEQLTRNGGSIEVPRLETSFSVDDLTVRMARDPDVVASFLYYMGMLTLTEGAPNRLRAPNLVVEKLFLDRLQQIYLPDPGDGHLARKIALDFFATGELQPLLDFFEDKLLPVLSNRDRGAPAARPGGSGSGMNEMVVKALFMSLLFDDTRYVTHSELEVERTYVDLCLRVRPERRQDDLFDLLFELKLVRRGDLAKTGRERAAMDAASLRRLKPVAKAFVEAHEQARRYRNALARRHPEIRLRTYAVVAVGVERMLGEEAEPVA